MLSSLLSPNKLQIQQPTQMWVFKSEPEIEQESDMSHDNSNSKKDGKIHLIAIYHNRGTMQRYILINFQEVSSTKGFSNVLMDDIDRIPLEFSRFLNSHKSSSSSSSPSGKMDSNPSNYVEIRKVGAIKDGYIGTFDYNCIIQSVTCRTIKEAVPHFMTWTPLFEISLQPLVSNIMMPADKKSVAYYGIQVINLQTMSSNTIHRRYSEFSILDDCIRHFFITQDALPPLPSKSVSFLVDHNDHQFLKVRKDGLEQYLLYLSKIPFIEHLPEYRQFLGYHSTYKLLSYDMRSCSNYEQIFLLDSTSKHSIMNSGCIYSASVSSVVNAYVCAELRIGDFLSKINGTDLTGLPYNSKSIYVHIC